MVIFLLGQGTGYAMKVQSSADCSFSLKVFSSSHTSFVFFFFFFFFFFFSSLPPSTLEDGSGSVRQSEYQAVCPVLSCFVVVSHFYCVFFFFFFFFFHCFRLIFVHSHNDSSRTIVSCALLFHVEDAFLFWSFGCLKSTVAHFFFVVLD